MDKDGMTEDRLHAYADGELAAHDVRDIEMWLKGNPDGMELLGSWKKQIADMKASYDPILDEPVPDHLTHLLKGKVSISRAPYLRNIAASIFLLILGGTMGWFGSQMKPVPEGWPALAVQAINSHVVYTSSGDRLVEVSASEPDVLHNWLKERVGHEIIAPDLTSFGFRFSGARIVPVKQKAAAMFIYQDDAGEKISLIVAPGEPASDNKAERFWASGDVKCFFWFHHSFGISVTGEISKERLAPLKEKAKQHFHEI